MKQLKIGSGMGVSGNQNIGVEADPDSIEFISLEFVPGIAIPKLPFPSFKIKPHTTITHPQPRNRRLWVCHGSNSTQGALSGRNGDVVPFLKCLGINN